MLILVVATGLYLNLKEFHFSNYRWLSEDNPTEKNKHYLDNEFNQGEGLVVVISLDQNYFQLPVTDELSRVVEKLRAVPFIKKVNSPLHAKKILKDSEGTLHNIAFEKALDSDLLSWEEYPQALQDSPYWGRLIAESEDIIAITVTVEGILHKAYKNAHKRRHTVLESITAILDGSHYLKNYGFAGETELNYRINQLTINSFFQLLPIMALLLALVLIIAYRSLIYALITITVNVCTLLVTLNITQWLGYAFNVISASLPILVVTISVADSIHIIRRWQQNTAGGNPSLADSLASSNAANNPWPCLKLCWQETWRPCFFTSATSACGFGVFYISDLIPLSQFGLTAFLSILLAYPLIMSVTFMLLYAFRPGHAKNRKVLSNHSISRIAAWAEQHRKKIISVSFASLAITLLCVPLAKSETNFLDVFFSQNSKTWQSFDLIDNKLNGSGSIDVILKGGEADAFKDIATFNKVQTYTDAVHKIPAIESTNSLLEPVEMVHGALSGQSERFPQTEDALAQELLFLEFSRTDQDSDILSEFVDFDYSNSRISLRTKNMKSSETRAALEQLAPSLEQLSLDAIVTGANVFFFELSAYVLKTQLLSMVFTGLFVWLLFILQFGIRLGNIGMLASLVPIAVTLGFQIIVSIPFDFSTVLVASGCLGLCIDDMIHYIHRFKSYGTGMSVADRLQKTTLDTWQPIVLTSIVLIVGFLTLLASEVIVINRFSALIAIAIALSLPSCFLLLPALLRHFQKARPVAPKSGM